MINGAEIFVRDERLTIKNLDRIKKYLVNNFQANEKRLYILPKVILKMKRIIFNMFG